MQPSFSQPDCNTTFVRRAASSGYDACQSLAGCKSSRTWHLANYALLGFYVFHFAKIQAGIELCRQLQLVRSRIAELAIGHQVLLIQFRGLV